MRRTLIYAVACFLSLPAMSRGQIDPPSNYVLNNPCPTAMVSSFPQGGSQTICVWMANDCVTGFSATMYGPCEDCVACSCMGATCACAGENFLETSGTGVFENDPPPSPDGGGPGPAPGGGGGPGAALDSTAGPVANLNASPGTHMLTNLASTQQQVTGPKRIFCSNKKDLNRITPLASKLVQAQPDTLTEFGKSGYKTKYLKCLKLKVGNTDEYFALFKIFKEEATNPNGDQDLTTDNYVGIRISKPVSEPAGGYVQLNSNAAGRVQKLGKFDGPNNYVREVGVRLPIKRATSGTPMTWFHLFGTFM